MKVLKWLDKNLEIYILICLLILIVCVMSYMVFMRFAMNHTPFWPSRVAQYSFIISTFFSVSYCIRRGASLRIDVLLTAAPAVVSRALSIAVKIIMLAFFAMLAYASWGVIGGFIDLGTRDTALNIPMYHFFTVVFVSFIITTIRCAQVLVFEFFPEKGE
ncbi:MAG: TRAP transporter small permease [Defluviitaleaceae bacterium]|nr:TRAP transporter small permease [Defluviitaleaceae bacterium]